MRKMGPSSRNTEFDEAMQAEGADPDPRLHWQRTELVRNR
jgi:hypothetical protein